MSPTQEFEPVGVITYVTVSILEVVLVSVFVILLIPDPSPPTFVLEFATHEKVLEVDAEELDTSESFKIMDNAEPEQMLAVPAIPAGSM